jgi:hypothetical protein
MPQVGEPTRLLYTSLATLNLWRAYKAHDNDISEFMLFIEDFFLVSFDLCGKPLPCLSDGYVIFRIIIIFISHEHSLDVELILQLTQFSCLNCLVQVNDNLEFFDHE